MMTSFGPLLGPIFGVYVIQYFRGNQFLKCRDLCSLLLVLGYSWNFKTNFNTIFTIGKGNWISISLVLMLQPHFGQVWGWSPTLGKVGDLESSGTPECSELDNKAQNISHWGVLGVIEKVLKRRYWKWPRIGHSDICSPSYGQKKGRESNWQFDSRPLKVGNRPLPDVRIESATWRWKDLDECYNFGLDLVAIGLHSRELWPFKVPRIQLGQFRDSISGVPTKCAIWM